MRLHVVYDAQGTILSASTLMPDKTDGIAPQYGVTVPKGQFAADIDVPAGYAGRGLVEIAEGLRVNAAGGVHTLVAKHG